MRFAVILRRRPDGSFQANVPALPEVAVSGAEREQTLEAARDAIAEAVAMNELAIIDVPVEGEPESNPWLETGGAFADDPILEPMLEEIYAARDAGRPSGGRAIHP